MTIYNSIINQTHIQTSYIKLTYYHLQIKQYYLHGFKRFNINHSPVRSNIQSDINQTYILRANINQTMIKHIQTYPYSQ